MTGITRIEVDNLFGDLSHKIELAQSGVTFIHGPNGCGKTTVLRLVSALFGRDLRPLRNIRYDALRVGLLNGETIEVKQLPAESAVKPASIERDSDRAVRRQQHELDAVNLRLSIWANGTERHHKVISQTLETAPGRPVQSRGVGPASLVERYLPFLSRIGARQWIDQRSNQMLSYTDVIEMYGDQLPFALPEWFTSATSLVNLELIESQRLLEVLVRQNPSYPSDQQTAVTEAVETYSTDLANKINETLAQSALLSQRRERSFPRRLILKEFPVDRTEAQLRDDYRRVEELLLRLADAGLYSEEASVPLPVRKLTPTERRVIALYLADLTEKLGVFAELLNKIEGLKEIVGKKLSRKRFAIDRANGMSFTTTSGATITLRPKQLSSGEQHQVVLFYRMIFSKRGKEVFLIDEPEISLHVEWQRQFLDDLQRVAKLTGHTFLIATHSPQIINGRLDLAIALEGGIA